MTGHSSQVNGFWKKSKFEVSKKLSWFKNPKKRHAQIDELRKKLVEAAKEANELKNEIMRFRSTKDEGHRLNQPQPQQRGGVCMNCIVMQQALTMANAALKGTCW